jgi:hypothetical protein
VKSTFPKKPFNIPPGDGAADSGRPGIEVARRFPAGLTFQNHIRKVKPAARLEHAADFREAFFFYWGKIQHTIGGHDIEGLILKRQRFG